MSARSQAAELFERFSGLEATPGSSFALDLAIAGPFPPQLVYLGRAVELVYAIRKEGDADVTYYRHDFRDALAEKEDVDVEDVPEEELPILAALPSGRHALLILSPAITVDGEGIDEHYEGMGD